MKSLVCTLLFVLSTHVVGAQRPLTPAEIAAIQVTAKSFADAFKDNNEDLLPTLLIPYTVLADILPADTIGENTYNDLVNSNLTRFKEWRAVFGDLKKYDQYWTVTVIPGKPLESKDWSSSGAVIHNTFVELQYSNRIKITLKIEDLVIAGDKCHILKID